MIAADADSHEMTRPAPDDTVHEAAFAGEAVGAKCSVLTPVARQNEGAVPVAHVVLPEGAVAETDVAVSVGGQGAEAQRSKVALALRNGDSDGHESSAVVVGDAYLLCLVLGWAGAHHFYLGRVKWGLLYMATFGCFGLGIVVDLFRIPLLVRNRRKNLAKFGTNDLFRADNSDAVQVSDAYALWLLGLFGAHQFYLRRPFHGFAYLCTFGLCGVGFAADLFRMPQLLHRGDDDISLFEAYLYLIPCGIFGLHHLYLGDWRRFILCLFTLNFLCVGFALDIFRLPALVHEAQRRKMRKAQAAQNDLEHNQASGEFYAVNN